MVSHGGSIGTPDTAALTPYTVALLNNFMHFLINQDVDFLRWVIRACN
jgi:hypothetical protein